MKHVFTLGACGALLAAAVGAQAASPLTDGGYAVALVDGDGAQIEIAQLAVQGGSYAIDMRFDAFTDHFLSMRPFKFVEGPETLWCHVPYPYEIKREISKDLVDLEYDFLFVWKRAGSYGIDLWNGVYYVLSPEGNRLRGTMHEIDMDLLSAPPPAGDLRLVGPADLEPADPDSHWLPGLVIHPL
ncbi:MAG: hypothetical protein N4A61_08270 [Pelagimonas sp.]|jgi:hypothetical protein|nr:hypothetical protein [Pelagimonas sp.]